MWFFIIQVPWLNPPLIWFNESVLPVTLVARKHRVKVDFSAIGVLPSFNKKVPLVAPVLSPRISDDPYVHAFLLSIAHKRYLVVDGCGVSAPLVRNATTLVCGKIRRNMGCTAHRDATG